MARRRRQELPGDPHDPLSLRALLERHLLWLETHHYAARTVEIRRATIGLFLRWCQERSITQAREVTRELLERYQRHLFYYRKRNGEPLCVSSQAHWLTALRSWFLWLVRERCLEHDPANLLQLPREEQRLPRNALSQQEVESVLAQADPSTPHGLRNRAIVETLYSTGLRRQEALNLHLADVDHERGTVLVRRGKGNKDRVVPIGARALAWIDKYLAEARPVLLGEVTSPYLFIGDTGRPIDCENLSRLVRRYLDRAGVQKQGACHLFRHTAATLMLEGGADIRYIQALLGHVSLNTTQIYTHVTIAKLREVHEKTHPGRLYRDPSLPPSNPHDVIPQSNAASAETGHDAEPHGGPADDDTDATALFI